MTKANLKRLEEGKLYYSISEVCAMTGLEQHVLRYWESEFPQLRPKKNRSGNRAYRAKEIKIIRYIKYLLYEEMYTIPGAKRKMADAKMSDLEGQLTLLRVPASAPQAASILPETPVADPSDLDGKAGPQDQAPQIRDQGADSIAKTSPSAGGDAAGSGAPGAGYAAAPADDDSHAHDGGPAAAKLREELRRVKQELQSLLAALAASASGRTGA